MCFCKTVCVPPSFRQASVSGIAKARDLQSSSTLEQFMAKLCLHHQRQIVDAFGFLQTEVKAVNSFNEEQVSIPAVSEKPISLDCARERSAIHGIEETLPVVRDINGGQVAPVSPGEQLLETDGPSIASIKNVTSIDLDQTDIGDNIEVVDDGNDVECKSTDIQPKCPNLLILKNNLGNLEAKKLSEVDLNIQQPNTGTLEQGPCASDTKLHAHSTDHDIGALSLCPTSHGPTDPKCLPVRSSDAPVKPCSIQRTTNVISSNFSRTAKKSSRGSHARARLGPIGNIVNDPDSKYDIVYVAKPITECKLQTQNHMLPRKNARKSTRGHLCFGDCWEIKTVRTLAHKTAENGSGNYPVPMPEITTSITPKQALAKPDGLPAIAVPFTGDCMETVKNKILSDQSVVTEMPGDIVEIPSEDLIVEPSQTGQTQQKDQIPSLLADEDCDLFVQQNCNVGIHDISASSEGSLNFTMANETTEKIATNESIDAPTGVKLGELETEVHNVATEALLNTVSSSIENNASVAEGLEMGSDLKTQNAAKCDFLTSFQKSKCQNNGNKNNSTMLQMACEPEANIKTMNSINPDNDEVESRMSDLVGEEITTQEQLGECREDVSESFVTKKGVAKYALPSDRCLRSGVSKGVSEQTISNMSDQTKQADLQASIHEKNIPESKRSLMSPKLTHAEENVPCQDGQYNLDITKFNAKREPQSPMVTQIEVIDNKVCTRHKQKLMMLKEIESDKEKKVKELPNLNEHKGQGCVLNDAPENEVNTPVSGESYGKSSPEKSIGVTERMLLRNRSSQIEHPLGNESSSPTINIPHTPERMPLRSRNSINVDEPVDGDSCSSPTAGSAEKLERMPLRNRNSGFTEQTVGKDSCVSSSPSSLDSAVRMPLRSRNSGTISRQVIEASSDLIKGTSGTITEQPSGEASGVSSKKLVSTGHMPLRSGNALMAEQSSSCNSVGSGSGTVSESPGRMSLRRSNTFSPEKQDCLQTPTKTKKLSPKLQKMCRSSVLSLVHKGEPNNTSANVMTDKLFNDQRKASSIPESFASFNLPTTSSLIPSPCKFLEALNGEANQHLISDLNSKFDKMQKGWVHMDKEGQPAPKPKNKADRLKEIWKSKRRIRKPRSIEQHKFSPVQMLFMKSFDLSDVCRWFLQSTETKSLVIVKNVNTRLPSETQLGFHTLPSVSESSDGVFPSLQAERLKKHLKKFAIASPVKSNAKNKRLIAKALAQGISKGKEKEEPRSATRISSKPQSSAGLMQRQSLESHSKVAASAKNPASARILRKYSNMREKKQVQQNSLKNLKGSLDVDNSHPMTKKVSKEKLSTRKGQKSAIVQKVKQLAKKAKTPAAKEKIPKGVGRGLRDLKEKDRISPKRVLPRVVKSYHLASPKTQREKEILVKAERSPQAKTDSKKSPLHKASESFMSQIMDVKPLLSEDQVLTRSQRKIEATLAQTGSPKTSTKRSMDTSVTSAKRTRTSK